MKTYDFSISGDRVAVDLNNGKTVQFVVWDLEEFQHENLKTQLTTALNICSTFDQIERHLRINGFDASLEDIFVDE